jgi:Fe-Mn family superoxide dismutase
MRLHHDRHHAAYVKNLNAALSKYPQLQNKSLEYLIKNLSRLPQDIRTTVRNNGGGHYNHAMFWQIMAPATGQKPSGALATAIDRDFGSFQQFQKQFVAAGGQHFGSGWVWLVLQAGKLKITTTANQDNPLTTGMLPIMGNDLWEHAYYLNYQNRRADYLQAWWQVVNWTEVGSRFDRALAG